MLIGILAHGLVVLKSNNQINNHAMKKALLFAALCCFGVQSSIFAQESQPETATNEKEKPVYLYFALGANINSGFKLNDKLANAGFREIDEATPEFALGFRINIPDSKMYTDIEISGSFYDRNDGGFRTQSISSSSRLRVHYTIWENKDFMFSAGGDVSYTSYYVNLFSRNNYVDLDDLPNTMNNSHVSLRSGLLNVGPSVAFGFLRDTNFPLRINAGYDIGLTNGKWKSDFASVGNTVKENGLGTFYVRLALWAW